MKAEIKMNFKDELEWKDFPDTSPSEMGYYYTYYWHSEDNCNYYKAIYWNGNEWVKWRKTLPELKVSRFIESSRSDYYTVCVEKIQSALGY